MVPLGFEGRPYGDGIANSANFYAAIFPFFVARESIDTLKELGLCCQRSRKPLHQRTLVAKIRVVLPFF